MLPQDASASFVMGSGHNILARYAKRNGDFVLVRSGSFEADGINELFEIV